MKDKSLRACKWDRQEACFSCSEILISKDTNKKKKSPQFKNTGFIHVLFYAGWMYLQPSQNKGIELE